MPERNNYEKNKYLKKKSAPASCPQIFLILPGPQYLNYIFSNFWGIEKYASLVCFGAGFPGLATGSVFIALRSYLNKKVEYCVRPQ